MAPTVAELAEDTAVHLLPRPAFEMVERDGFVFEAGRHRASVQRLRLGDVQGAVAWAREECARRGIGRCEWWVGWSATPEDLAQQLLGLELVPDDEEPTLTGMSIDREPPAASHVAVRRIETIDEQLAALEEVDWDVWGLSEDARASRRAHERERFDPQGTVHHFAVYDGDRPVGFGRAIDMDAGVALMGGAVLPAARGRGVYRALVHARWEHAVARDTPLLVVQAGHMSEPVLTGLGFESHGVLRLLMDPGVASRHGDDRDEHRAG
ncbi:MAG TPA: GNAT family N-acetyltransferase [Gaiellaceae bacterium]|nr:GNAT family N-acetyltransferase [Gaiellaceae bacterium]